MQQALHDTLHRLIGAIEKTASASAGVIVREGRFASLVRLDRVDAHVLPANALDALTAPVSGESVPAAIASLASFEAAPLSVLPVRDASGQTSAAICVAVESLAGDQLAVVESIAQTLGVLIDTLDSAQQHATRTLHDPLTHLPNQAMFLERLTDELASAQRTQARVTVVTIDLDGFAEINDTHGREFGDRVLQRVGARLHHAVRRSDLLARLGEDEFGIMAVQRSEQPEGAYLASRMIKIINQPMEVDGIMLELGASVGLAVYPADGIEADVVLANSHAAMHRAKIRGQNQFEYFTPQMNADAMERLELESRLRLAIEKNQLILHYQPVVDRDGKVTGVEALVRWLHPEQGLISPAKFIPIAEQTGLIVPIGTWVLRQATHQAKQWAIEGIPMRINVNVSTLQFQKSDFVDIVIEALERSELDPQLLELELTESLFVMNESDLAKKLAALRQLGVRIAIDDFGAGYSNLSRLHNLPIDTLKIDRAFVSEITVKESPTPLHHRTAVLRAMATLGNSLGLRLVAEGVECDDQVKFLKRIGYEAMQGYFFSKPVPVDQVAALVRTLGLSQLTHPRRLNIAA